MVGATEMWVEKNLKKVEESLDSNFITRLRLAMSQINFFQKHCYQMIELNNFLIEYYFEYKLKAKKAGFYF